MAHIELHEVGLKFQLQLGGRTSMKDVLLRRQKSALERAKVVEALRCITLRIDQGDRLGILGRNGAGKSSLLRVLAGIYPPTSGRLCVEGRVSALFDLATGFESEATGWENIRYRSYLQGETPQSVQAKLPAIAEFSGLGDFLNLPLRCYSDGMRVRLAFSIATAIDPEILVLDEVLSVGDLEFQSKARRRLEEMMSRARLIVMVSHDLGALLELCSRGVWLDQGQVHGDGPIAEVVAAYMASAPAAVKYAA